MKYLYATLFLIVLRMVFLPDVMVSATENQLITELKVVDNDTTFRYLYVYDDSGNKVVETKYYQKDSTWIRKSLNEWIYNGKNCVTQNERTWSADGWLMKYTIDYGYENNQMNSETHKIYNNGTATLLKSIIYQYISGKLATKKEFAWQSNLWVLSDEMGFTYLNNGKTDSITTSTFQSGQLTGRLLSTFSYSPDGTLVSELLQVNVNNNWVNTGLTNWFYKPNTLLITSIRNKKWIPDTSTWENTQLLDYQYNDHSDLICETYQRWKTMFWENDLRYDYQYDNNNVLLKKTVSKPIYQDWRSLVSIVYSDFSMNKANTVESKYEFWGGATGALTTSFIPFVFNTDMTIQRGSRIHISYVPVSDISVITPVITSSLKYIPVYPNPSDGIYYIDTQKYAIQSWVVTDLKGQVVKKQVQSFASGVIDLTDFPKGIYVLQVKTAEEQLIQKLIKE